jgi:hypothetical protein
MRTLNKLNANIHRYADDTVHRPDTQSCKARLLNIWVSPGKLNWGPFLTCPLGECSPLLYCLEEWRVELRISPPGDKIQPRGTTSPLLSKFAPWGEVKNGPEYIFPPCTTHTKHDFFYKTITLHVPLWNSISRLIAPQVETIPLGGPRRQGVPMHVLDICICLAMIKNP